MTKERIQKLLAQANVASRRASEDLITAGRVRVNDVVAKLGDKADPETDTITVDGARIKLGDQHRVYIALNKPKQVLSTDKPHKGDNRPTVASLIGSSDHLFSVGRLDADSEGLVVMTNDGDLAFRLTHPRYRHSKTYRVEVVGLPTAETLERWQTGIVLDDGKTSPCKVDVVKGSVKGSILRIVMTEGKKRQIRRVAAALGHPVTRLTRTHIGMFALGDLAPGEWREMTPREVMQLKTPAPEIKLLRGQPRGQGWRFGKDNAPSSDDQAIPRRPSRNPTAPPTKRHSTGIRSVRNAAPDADDSAAPRPPKRRPSGSRPARNSTPAESSAGNSTTTRPPKRRPTGKRSTPAASPENTSDRPSRTKPKPYSPRTKDSSKSSRRNGRSDGPRRSRKDNPR